MAAYPQYDRDDGSGGELPWGSGADTPDAASGPEATPGGEVYDWYQRGLGLLDSGNPAAAVVLLGHAAEAYPNTRSILEALARAQFDAGMYPEAERSFATIVDLNPADDYAQFGYGLAAAKTGNLETAVEHLALAAAMRPDVSHYAMALRGARSALAAARR